MAKTDVYRPTGPHPLLLPTVLFAVLFGVAVLLAQVAPSRVTSGIYQVFVGDSMAVIPTEALTCTRTGDTVTCTTRVGSHDLVIDTHYTGTPEPGNCNARHGDRTVSCQHAMGFYGHASHNVRITDNLGLTRTQLADLNASAPWWRLTNELTTALLILTGALGVVAGVATFLLRRRLRPLWPDQRRRLVIGTAVAALALFTVTGLLFAPSQNMLLAVSPVSLLATAMIAVWQWQLTGHRGGRVASAVVATVTVTIYTGVAMLVFLIQSGFDD